MTKLKTLIILTFVAAFAVFADNTLTLTWNVPPGFQGTLFSATNLNGTWSPIGPVDPPYITETTNQQAYFLVILSPTNTVNGPVIFASNPNDENLTPQFTNRPAIAYDWNGALGIYVWSVPDQAWN